MPQKLYTEGEAIALAGKMLGRIVELLGMFFFLMAKMFSVFSRCIFWGMGLFIDGYNAIKKSRAIRFSPELRVRIEETVFLAAGEGESGWKWIDEAILPVKQALAATQLAFRDKTMKRNEIIKKDREAVIMALTLKKIVFEIMLDTERYRGSNSSLSKKSETVLQNRFYRVNVRNNLDVFKQELLRVFMCFRFFGSRCPDDPARKTLLLVRLSEFTLKYHQTGKIKFRKKIQKIINGRYHFNIFGVNKFIK